MHVQHPAVEDRPRILHIREKYTTITKKHGQKIINSLEVTACVELRLKMLGKQTASCNCELYELSVLLYKCKSG